MLFFWNEADSTYYFIRSCTGLVEGYLVSVIWQRRHEAISNVHKAATAFRTMIALTPIDERINQRFEEWRLQNCSCMVRLFRNVLLFFTAVVACRSEQILFNWADASSEVKVLASIQLCFLLWWNALVGYFASRPLTARRADVFFGLCVLGGITRHVTTDLAYGLQLPQFRLLGFGCCLAASLCNMRPTSGFVGNLALSFTICYCQSASELPFLRIAVEILGFIFCTIVPMLVKRWIMEMLASQLELEEAKQAMHTMLSGLCDAVVMLNHDFKIVKATPQLAHILCRGLLVDQNTLEGSSMVDYLASSEHERFRKFIFEAQENPHDTEEGKGLAHMIQFTLGHKSRCKVRVDLFHVHFKCVDSHHIIGLREIREASDQADEYLAQDSVLAGGAAIQVASSGATKHPRARSSRSSGSSNISSSTRVSNVLRPMHEVEEIQLKLDPNNIWEYKLCFNIENDSTCAQKLKACLVGNSKDRFLEWYSKGSRTLMENPFSEAEYNEDIYFRHPTAACASPNIVLHAASATIELFHEWEEGDDNSAEGRDFVQLSLRKISQVCLQQKTDAKLHTELVGVLE